MNGKGDAYDRPSYEGQAHEIRKLVTVYLGSCLFKVAEREAISLNKLTVPSSMREAFKKAGRQLTKKTKIKVLKVSQEWEILDGADHYLVEKDGKSLAVSLKYKYSWRYNPQEFARLVDYASGALAVEDDLNIRILIAMELLGPVHKDLPPFDLHRKLVKLVTRYGQNLEEKKRRSLELEIVLAFGCGKWREVPTGTASGGWSDVWIGSLSALVQVMEGAVKAALAWLGKSHELLRSQGDFSAHRDAVSLAMSLINPEKLALPLGRREVLEIEATDQGAMIRAKGQGYEAVIPPGAKFVATLDGEAELKAKGRVAPLLNGTKLILSAHQTNLTIVTRNQGNRSGTAGEWRIKAGEKATVSSPTGTAVLSTWECTCGNVNCAARHRLSAWNPGEMDLWHFVSVAVTGLRVPTGCPVAHQVEGSFTTIRSVSFAQGMHYARLCMELQPVAFMMARLRLVPLELKHCSCGRKYTGPACPNCMRIFNSETMMRKVARGLIVAADENYEQKLWWRCRNVLAKRGCNAGAKPETCNNLFGLEELGRLIVCGTCHKPVIEKNRLKKLFETATTFQQRKTKLQSIYREEGCCPHCGSPLHPHLRCPGCQAEFRPSQREISAWSRNIDPIRMVDIDSYQRK